MVLSYEDIMRRLESLSSPESVAGMARFGIKPDNAFGVSIPDLRKIAKESGGDYQLAQQLWSSGIHEARILACFICPSEILTEEQMETWVKDFDSWDMCDQCCSNLFDKTGFAHKKAVEWSTREEEFVKRAGFVLMASLAVHDKKTEDKEFVKFLSLIKKEAVDNRNYVKKAVNWALRQVGKRNINLNREAIKTAEEIHKMDSKGARWIAADALRELTDEKIQKRLK